MTLRSTLFTILFSLSSAWAFAQAPVTDSSRHADSAAPVNPVTDSTGSVTQSAAPTPQGGGQSASTKRGTISGTLVDNDNKPVAYATVTLLRSDSSVVNGALTGDDGSFSISPTGTGTFILGISAIGLKQRYIPNIQITPGAMNKDLGNVKSSTTTTKLKEVDVVAEKPIMQMDVDKKVFNVEKNTTTAGGSASDVLSNVPAVSVDVDGTVSLRNNSNVTILIDGKPATLLGSDQASALQSLPASSIESVEVITNPSAKYDAQGPTGIINIVTKKDGRTGVNGSASLGAGTHDKYNASFSLNVKKNKWNVFLNSNARFNSNYNNTSTDINYKDASGGLTGMRDYTDEHSHRHFDGFFNTIGASYDINKNNNITLTQNINKMNFGYTDNATFQTTSNFGADKSQEYARASNANGGPLSSSTSLDYKGKFKKKGEELSANATFAYSTITRTQNYTTDYTFYIDTPATRNKQQVVEHAPASGDNETFTAFVDYTDPLFTKNGKLGLGAKTQLYRFNSNNTPTTQTTYSGDSAAYTSGQFVDPALLSIFTYTQQVHAAYINWNDQLGKFSYQVGLRGEYSEYNGTDNTGTGLILLKQSYPVSLFPSAFLSYQLPNQQSVYINYSRRVNRPNFFQLLPYKDISNPATVNQGNPDLKPEFIHNVEFSYSKSTNRGDNLILSAYYTYTQNLSERVSRYITGSLEDSTLGIKQFAGRLYTTPVNIASGTTYGAELTGHVQILPIWDATLDVNVFQNSLTIGSLDTAYKTYVSGSSSFSWFGKVNTNIKLPANFSLQFNANYESPKTLVQGKLDQVYWVDVALRKNMLKNKLTVVANCSDIFNTRKYTTNTSLSAYNEVYFRDRETRVGNLTVTYRFGSSKAPQAATAGGKRGKKDSSANKPQIPDTEQRENNLKGGEDNDSGGGNSGGGGPKGGGSQ